MKWTLVLFVVILTLIMLIYKDFWFKKFKFPTILPTSALPETASMLLDSGILRVDNDYHLVLARSGLLDEKNIQLELFYPSCNTTVNKASFAKLQDNRRVYIIPNLENSSYEFVTGIYSNMTFPYDTSFSFIDGLLKKTGIELNASYVSDISMIKINISDLCHRENSTHCLTWFEDPTRKRYFEMSLNKFLSEQKHLKVPSQIKPSEFWCFNLQNRDIHVRRYFEIRKPPRISQSFKIDIESKYKSITRDDDDFPITVKSSGIGTFINGTVFLTVFAFPDSYKNILHEFDGRRLGLEKECLLNPPTRISNGVAEINLHRTLFNGFWLADLKYYFIIIAATVEGESTRIKLTAFMKLKMIPFKYYVKCVSGQYCTELYVNEPHQVNFTIRPWDGLELTPEMKIFAVYYSSISDQQRRETFPGKIDIKYEIVTFNVTIGFIGTYDLRISCDNQDHDIRENVRVI